MTPTQDALMERLLWHFSFSPRETPLQAINRLAQQWAPRLYRTIPPITDQTPVVREWWSHDEIGQHTDRMAIICPEIVVNHRPRFDAGALILFRFADGVVGQLDGRHRCAVWRKRPGTYEVLVLDLGEPQNG